MPEPADIPQNADEGISDFQISSQSLIKENAGTSGDIDMKLRLVTKIDKRNKTRSKKFDDEVMLENCDVIVIFFIFAQFGAVRKPDSGYRACKSYILSNSDLLPNKN